MEKTILNVEGMSCGHCEKSIRDALMKVDNVKSVEVFLKEKRVEVDHENLDFKTIREVIESQGFDVLEA